MPTFTATPVAQGKTGAMASVDVPEEVQQALGGVRLPVTVTVNGFTFRTTVSRMGGRTVIGFNTANRAAAGVEAGTPVEVHVEREDEPRVVDPPVERPRPWPTTRRRRRPGTRSATPTSASTPSGSRGRRRPRPANDAWPRRSNG